MKVLIISPFHGGSHQAWAEGLRANSAAEIRIISLPGRFWKWRMHGSAVTLSRRFMQDSWQPDLLLATDMIDLALFLALTRKKTSGVPAVIYFHENQLTYPLPGNPRGNRVPEEVPDIDLHYPFINLASMLAADRIVFNSRFHREEFLGALPCYLEQFPDHRLPGSADEILAKSSVIHPGIESPLQSPPVAPKGKSVPVFLWNQRWEYDKNPGAFFTALVRLKEEGCKFQLIACGEQYSRKPASITRALEILQEETVHCGYVDRNDYLKILRDSDIVLSTADHEFFGISVLEAIINESFPVLPARLSYPELIPEGYHRECLYRNHGEMMGTLRKALKNRDWASGIARKLSSHLQEIVSWEAIAQQYDRLFEEVASSRPQGNHPD